jgi:ribonuclease D
MRELNWVDTPAALKEAVEASAGAKMIALDAEMDSYFVYRTKLCLVQMTVGERDYLIDPLALDDLTPLNKLTENPEIMKVFHAGENDVPYFRGRGVKFRNLFDTHIAAKFLELPSKSLGGLVEIYFDTVLAKDQSRADWRIRPLPDDQVAYARQDTLYLCSLAEKLAQELKEADLEKEASQTFEGLEELDLRVKEFDPDGWAKIKGARELSGVQWVIMRDLFAWRERVAEVEDLALFRVAPNGALIGLARKRFRNADQIRGWARSRFFKQHAQELADILENGRKSDPISFPQVRKHSRDWSAADEKLFEVLRKWRNEESEKRGIEPSRIFSNRQLKNMARAKPKDSKGLAKVEGLEPWKLEEFGPTVIELVGADSK